jgi:hypothetical protein
MSIPGPSGADVAVAGMRAAVVPLFDACNNIGKAYFHVVEFLPCKVRKRFAARC